MRPVAVPVCSAQTTPAHTRVGDRRRGRRVEDGKTPGTLNVLACLSPESELGPGPGWAGLHLLTVKKTPQAVVCMLLPGGWQGGWKGSSQGSNDKGPT